MTTIGRFLLPTAVIAAAALFAGSSVPTSPSIQARAAGAPAATPFSGQLIVQWRHAVPLGQRGLDDLDAVHVMRTIPVIDASVVRVTTGSIEAARALLLADARVAEVANDGPIHADMSPNDELYPRQWALQMIQAPWAWEMLRGGSNVVVGVLDSGVDLTHPDLVTHLLPIGCNVVADGVCPADGHGTPPTDTDGHGSHVAGIVAAGTDNHDGIAGISWNAAILPVKVTTGGTGTESDFLSGLVWAVDHGANVLNLSFSEPCGAPESSAMRSAIDYAWSHGVVLVASAGNDSGCPAGVFPAADPKVVSVAATDMNDRPLPDSNFGAWVRASAPGDRILSTWTAGQYSILTGTSSAAPQVAGLAALLSSIPGATNASVVRWMLSTCDVPAGWNPAYGCGRINAYRAVSLAVRGSDPHMAPPAPVTIHLSRGWNNLLYVGPTREVDTALATIKGKIGSLYAWDPVRREWQTFLPGQPAATNIQVLNERSAYWIYMQSEADLTMAPTGTSPPQQLTLVRGWNNLALSPGSLPAMLQQFSIAIEGIFSWNPMSANWNAFFTGKPSASDLGSLKADTAYWVFASNTATVGPGR